MESRSPSNKIIVILGPTSSGKSDVAIRLAKKFNGEIISADSRQVYRGLDIGTGKIEADHSAEIPQRFANSKSYAGPRKNKPYLSYGIPHHLIDNISLKTNYNAAKFKKDAEKIIKDILKRGKLPIICGGTGFWIKSIVDNISYPEVKPDGKLRRILHNKSAKELFKMLKKLDPKRANSIDAKNPVRLIRAIEICKTLGKVPSIQCHCEEVQRQKQSRDCHASLAMTKPYNSLQIGIKLPKEKLYKNIEKRLKKRFRQGMIDEVKNLHEKQKLSWKKIESFGLGYFWIPKYLHPVKYATKRRPLKAEFNRVKSKQDLFEKIYQAEKDYAKRQMTWFKKDARIKWISDYKNIKKEVSCFIR